MKKTITSFPKEQPDTFPIKVSRGNSTATIYRVIDAKGYETFKLPYMEEGRRKFHRFPNYDKARVNGNNMLDQMARGNADAVTIGSKEKLIYTSALEILRPFGVRLDTAARIVADSLMALDGLQVPPAEACRDYARRHSGKIPDKLVADVVREFIAAKETDGRSSRYLEDLRYRLGQPEGAREPGKPAPFRNDAHGFADAFTGAIGHIDGAQIQAYLDGLKLSPRSRNNFRGAITSLFEYAKARKYLPHDWNEFGAVGKAKDNGGPIEIFTPEEMTALLSTAKKSKRELVPFLVLGGFAGLRSAEIARLEWQDVKFTTGYIVVEKEKAKQRARRVVTMTNNLKSWLESYKNETGMVWPHGHAYLYEALSENAVTAKVPWKRNALRHSYISYRVAEGGDVNRTALEAGNSPQVIFSSYRELVTPEDAKRWFAVRPRAKHSRKIVELTLVPNNSDSSTKAAPRG